VQAIDIYNISALETAIDTVQQHHDDQRVWVEYGNFSLVAGNTLKIRLKWPHGFTQATIT